MPITSAMRKSAHTPSANRKRAKTLSAIRAFREKHGIPYKKRLSKTQLAIARGGAPLDVRFVKGSIPIGKLGAKPKPQSVARQYVTTARVQFGHDTVKLVDRVLRSGNKQLAGAIVVMINRVLNGGI